MFQLVSSASAVVLIAALASACSAPDATGGPAREEVEQAQQALTNVQQRVLGFETPASDWSSSRAISSSSTVSQGSAALAITPNGYVELLSVPLASLGPVKSQISFDLQIPQPLSWGEARLILSLPSQGMGWQDLGSVALAGLPVGAFNKLSFTVPASAKAALESTYTDLRLRIVLNVPSTSAPLLLDHFDVAQAGGGTAPSGPASSLTLTHPRGFALSTMFMSASDRLQLDDRVTLAQAGQLPALAGLGSSGVQVGAGGQVYGDVYSGGGVLLRSSSHVYGSVRAAGSITGQDPVLVDGGATPNTAVPAATTTISVSFPAPEAGKIVGPDGPAVSIAPGSYESLVLRSRGRVRLQPGAYYFGTFNSEPQAEIELTGSPTTIYVKNSFRFEGGFKQPAGEEGQVLVGYLGESPAFLQAPFVGTIAAPNATVELHRPTTGHHRGSFFGKNVHVFSDASIGYLPLRSWVVCPDCRCAVGYSGPNCEKLCASSRDTDQDGILDCDDLCPLHAGKPAPGKCGCAVSEKDTDVDGTPDCHDRCPEDPAHVAPTECGCREDTRKPAGTACSNAFCPGQTDATCDDNGVCGDPNACRPEPICKPLETSASNYFICTNRSWQEAAASCAAVGMRLARIDTYAENERLRGVSPGPVWIGGNALDAAGAWRWAENPSGAGEQFWMGSAGGVVLGNRFTFWAAGAPTTNRCLTLDPKDGRWKDQGCSAALPYICEYSAPGRVGEAPKLNLAPDPDPLVCTPPPSGMLPVPLTLEAMNDDAQIASTCTPGDDDCYVGAGAQPPPNDGTRACPADPSSSACPLTAVVKDRICETDLDCAVYGADFVCRVEKEGLHCDRTGACGHHATARCGKVNCPQDGASACEQVDVCGDEDSTTFEPQVEPGALATESPDPATFYTKPPDFTNSTEWFDPATVDPAGDDAKNGVKHMWCKLKPQKTDKLQPAKLATAKQGKSSGGGPIDFSFDPNMRFEASPNPLAFGESNMKLEAAASLDSTVTLTNFLKRNFTRHIIEASAGVVVERCRIKTSDSKLRLLEFDFSDQLPASLKFDTDSLKSEDGSYPGRECSRALLKFQEAADRVKKAFYDAKAVLRQYEDLRKGNLTFAGDLCTKLGIASKVVPGFPGGNLCADGEPAELTINRLLWYYQGDGTGQVDRMAEAASGISGVTGKLLEAIRKARGEFDDTTSFDIPLTLPTRTETRTVFETEFTIGPVPVMIEVDTAVSYGLGGSIDFGVTFPTSLNGSAGNLSNPDSAQPANLAHARVIVEPFAAAGLALFAGVGIRFASFGVEGSINLARIRAPFRAGVGLGVISVNDTRAEPTSLTELALKGGNIQDVMPFGKGRSYRFYLTHDYAAEVRVQDVLRGTVNGKVRVKFGFFRRTWRRQIYSFKGLEDQTFPLLEGSGRAELFTIGNSRIQNANDMSGMGLSEPQLPIMLLEPVPFPSESDPPPDGAEEFEPGELERPFYDDLCCSQLGEKCGTVDTPSCCGELGCVIGKSGLGTCSDCRPTGTACDSYNPCCAGNDCSGAGTCEACQMDDQPCEDSADCCMGSYCNDQGRCDSRT
jgi:hypothetical protein